MLKQMISEEEAIDVLRNMGRRVFGKRWMVAVWEVEEDADGKGTLNFVGRVGWRFPVGDFAKCVEMLKADLDAEVGSAKPPVPPPLEIADWLSPRRNGEDDAEGECVEKEIDELFNPPGEGG